MALSALRLCSKEWNSMYLPKAVEEQINKIRFVHPIAALFANVRFLEVDYNLIARAPRGGWFVKHDAMISRSVNLCFDRRRLGG